LGVAVAGNYAFVADYDSDLQVIDVSDPANPWIAASLSTPSNAFDVEVLGDYAYVAASTAGLAVVDVANPLAPQLVAVTPTACYGGSIAIRGPYIYLEVGCGMQVLEIFDPVAPRCIGNIQMSDPQDITVSGDYVFVANMRGGLVILPTQCESTSWVERDAPAGDRLRFTARPNPSCGATSILFEMPDAGPVRVAICDPSGRLIRTLHDGLMGAGGQALHWNGRDDRGRRVAAGIYLVRVSARAGTARGPVAILR
jgi:hypothetical protein